jgi:hypothetical protein
MSRYEYKSPPVPITETKAWATYVEDMAKLGVKVVFGQSKPSTFYDSKITPRRRYRTGKDQRRLRSESAKTLSESSDNRA